MNSLPTELKLSRHAKQRLEERTSVYEYDLDDLMKSECRWYSQDDLILNSNLYLHSLYVCRKSDQIGYITNGDIEVIYNELTNVAITVMEIKDKFKPFTSYIKPERLTISQRMEAVFTEELCRKLKSILQPVSSGVTIINTYNE